MGESGQDIIESIYSDMLKDIPTHSDTLEMYADTDDTALVLVRNVWKEGGNLKEREYAYVIGGVLPTEFECGDKVPVRFHVEAEKYTKANGELR